MRSRHRAKALLGFAALGVFTPIAVGAFGLIGVLHKGCCGGLVYRAAPRLPRRRPR